MCLLKPTFEAVAATCEIVIRMAFSRTRSLLLADMRRMETWMVDGISPVIVALAGAAELSANVSQKPGEPSALQNSRQHPPPGIARHNSTGKGIKMAS
jgi:hypothetical protein